MSTNEKVQNENNVFLKWVYTGEHTQDYMVIVTNDGVEAMPIPPTKGKRNDDTKKSKTGNLRD